MDKRDLQFRSEFDEIDRDLDGYLTYQELMLVLEEEHDKMSEGGSKCNLWRVSNSRRGECRERSGHVHI